MRRSISFAIFTLITLSELMFLSACQKIPPLKVSINNGSIVVASVGDPPVTINRIVINNHVGVRGCDSDTDSKRGSLTLNMGDAHTFAFGAWIPNGHGGGSWQLVCGNEIVQITIYTDKGNATYNLTNR